MMKFQLALRNLNRTIALAGALVLVAACSNSAPIQGQGPSAVNCEKSVLTGECFDSAQQVMVVKIDDVGEARPQFHLNEADLVIVEPVEGGLTRLFAVYNSQLPEEVGPIRSARITDTDLVGMFGNPGFVYSGATTRLRPLLPTMSAQLVGAPQDAAGLFRDGGRLAPHNLFADLSLVTNSLLNPEGAKLHTTNSWKFGSNPNGIDLVGLKARWPSARKKFLWNSDVSKWEIYVYDELLKSQVDPTGATEVATADNVFVMAADYLPNPFGDKWGAHTPYPQTVGKGQGWLLTNGQAFRANWSRESANHLPIWSSVDGVELKLKPGRTWWVILPSLTYVDLVLARHG